MATTDPLLGTRAPSVRNGDSPAPKWLRWLARLASTSLVFVMFFWIFNYLGGLSLSPKVTAEGINDTGVIFNWHPLLLTIAFPVLMGEAVLAYKAPIIGGDSQPRSSKKTLHAALHGTCAVLVTVAVVAAFKSHSMKLPSPIPDLYSAHSWLGLATLALMGQQVAIGIWAYLFPAGAWTEDGKAKLRSVHVGLGLSTFAAGLATMATGLQEKAAFIQMAAKPSVRAPIMVLPAVMVVLLLVCAVLYLYHHAPMANTGEQGEEEDESTA